MPGRRLPHNLTHSPPPVASVDVTPDEPAPRPRRPDTPAPTAFVRAASGADAAAVAELQVRAWRANHAAALGAEADTLDTAAATLTWRRAVERPPSPEHRVLVATASDAIVGFAATAPQDGEGAGEIVALEVDPTRTASGHGSRLLAACTDLLREAGAVAVGIWLLEDDGARAGFLRAAGFASDGARRTLDVAGRPVQEHHWSARL